VPAGCSLCSGKFTGGGQVPTAGGKGTFGFNARGLADGTASGHFNWVNHATGCHIQGPVTTLLACGNQATFTGTCSGNTSCTSYTVKVTDNGEPGANDTISVTIVGGSCSGNATSPLEQTISKGNIQSH
jgi:uncharacterized GH25 family protein